MAAVQYTFTHKQYTEQHNETEYTERNIHNSKNTQEIENGKVIPWEGGGMWVYGLDWAGPG